MPAFVLKEGSKYRVVHGSGAGMPLILMEDGVAVDGGGFESRIEAGRLAKECNRGRRREEESDDAEERAEG